MHAACGNSCRSFTASARSFFARSTPNNGILRTQSGGKATSRPLVALNAMQAFTIVGGGRVGQALFDMNPESDVIIRRGEAVEGSPGPIIVCTRNSDLQGVIDATPTDRRGDLVFLQNGMIQPFLEKQGLADNTQALIFFAVAKMGDKPTDGKTELNPEGLTAAWGRHADALAARLQANGLSCKVLERQAFQESMLEKLIWICAFMLVGTAHSCTVGEVAEKHRDEVETLMDELAAAGGKALGVSLSPEFKARLIAYTASVAHFPSAIKEFEWRNGWFYGLSQAAEAAGQADPMPTHTWMLKAVGAI